ncbi:MAG: hypothetical protein Q9208_002745 [Pyrenodesmia sp. 3 TL-2023]
MHSKTLAQAAAVAFYAFGVHSQITPSDEPLVEAEDIQAVVPTELLSPAYVRDANVLATSIAAAADSFIASITAAPEFSSVASVLATAVPLTAQEAIANDPEGFLLSLVRGAPVPSYLTALPPSVEQYVQSVAEDAAQIVTSDFGALYTSVSSEVAELATGAPIIPVSGGFVSPTGGYGGVSNFTGPRPTGSAAPPGSSPQAFPGAASSLRAGSVAAAVVAAGMGVGAWLLF